MFDIAIIAQIVTGIISVASVFCASTATPDPSTLWGKVYRVIEVLGLVVGKTKDKG